MITLSFSSLPQNPKIVVTGDIHINTSRFYDFELKRIKYLANKIRNEKPDLLILNGDILDKAKPTLQDIDLFYKFIDYTNCSNIILIAGNHEVLSTEKTCYDYLPQLGYIYVDIAKLNIADKTMLFISNHKLQEIKKHRANFLFTHYRTAVNEFMTDEFDNKYVSDNFEFTFLSDIHMDFKPYFNIIYTSSPNSLKFEEKRKIEYGFLVFDLIDGEITNLKRELINVFHKYKLLANKDNNVFIKKEIETNPSNLYKLSVTSEELKKEFNYPNIIGIDLLNEDFYDEVETKEAVLKLRQYSLDPYDIIIDLIKADIDALPSKIKKNILADIKQGLNNY